MTMHDLLLEVSRRLPKILKDGSVVQMKHPVSYFLVPCCSSITGKINPHCSSPHSKNKMLLDITFECLAARRLLKRWLLRINSARRMLH